MIARLEAALRASIGDQEPLLQAHRSSEEAREVLTRAIERMDAAIERAQSERARFVVALAAISGPVVVRGAA